MRSISPDGESVGAVSLRYWEPEDDLRYYIGSVYLFTTIAPGYRDMTRADVPQLRFMLSSGGVYTFYDGTAAETPEICMLGPTMGATGFVLREEAKVIGVSVLPLGWLALGCGDAQRWSDRLYDVAEMHGPPWQDRLERLRAAPDMDEAIDGLWSFLRSQLKPVNNAMVDLVSKIDAWLSESDSPRVEDIVAATGLSARQLARYTNRLYGAPPKLLARKYRALRCASQIVIDKKNWTELCDEGNFYDQSHFIREIKQFLGHTPHQLLNDPTAVARLTVQRRALTGLVKLNRIS